MKKDYRLYIDDIVNSSKNILEYTKGFNFDEFVKDKKTVDAVIRNLEIIGEASKRIPEDLKEKYPRIPWHAISGMRNKVIHEYFGVDCGIIWKTVTEKIPNLVKELRRIIEETEEG